ncbi:hypothetical protein FACS1894177_08430 [Bacteroidia bacterium]|nr:hypothetical protein FACS1894177_08430 [Bacteroidia bacterium]
MGEELSCKPLKISDQFYENNAQVYDYGYYAFGYFQAVKYKRLIQVYLDTLPDRYTAYPECRHLQTKSRMYRNIILDSHLIIYRITDERIEVLDIVHSASSIRRIREVRRIRL